MPEELTPTALAKITSWAFVHEWSQDSLDAIHTYRKFFIGKVGRYLATRERMDERRDL